MKKYKEMKLFIYITFGFLFILFQNTLFSQGVFTSKANGVNWSTGTNSAFNLTSGSDADGIPDSDDDVIIASGHTILVNGAYTCKSIVINAASATTGLTIGVNSLNVGSGSVTINAPTAAFISQISLSTGSLTCGNISIGGGATSTWIGQIIMTNTATINCTGVSFTGTAAQAKLTMAASSQLKIANGTMGTGGTFTCSTGTVEFTTLTGGQTINSYTYYNLKNSNTSGTNTAVGNVTIASSGTLTTTAGGTLNMSTFAISFSGSNTITNNGTIQTQNTSANPFTTAQTWGGTGTLEYNGSNQTIVAGTYTAMNLVLSNTGTKTLPSSTIGGSLTMSGSTSATTVASFSVSGALTLSGTSNLTIGVSAFNVGGLLTVNLGATWSNTLYTVTFKGGITNSGTFTAGSGIQTFSTNAQALTGTISIPNITITGVTVTNNNTLTVSTALVGTGGLTQAVNASLVLGGTSAITTITAVNSNNTVEYSGAAQTVHDNTYVNLTLSGSEKKSMKLSEVISGTLTILGTAYREYTEDFETAGIGNFTVAHSSGVLDFVLNTASTCTSINAARVSTGSNDAYLFTKAVKLKAFSSYAIGFTIKRTGTFNVYVGTTNLTSTASSGTLMYTSSSDPGSCSVIAKSSTTNFIPTVDGIYYFTFRVTNNTVSNAIIDDITITETLPETITWTGLTNTTWSTTSNWDLGRAPISSDIIVIPSGKTYYPITIPAGSYNSLSVNNGTLAGTTTINATSIARDLTIVSSSTNNIVTIGSDLSVGGSIYIGNSGSAFTFNCNASVTGAGSLVLGNNTTALTSNLSYPISVAGTLTLGTNTSSVTNISYSTTTGALAVIRASNSGSFVFYGAVNYTATSGDQIVMKSQYNGPVTASGAGNRFMEGDLDINDNLTISGGKWYSGNPTDVTFTGTLGTDGNVKMSNSPYKGSGISGRWQGIFLASDLGAVGANDLITSLSFYLNNKYSDRAFNNFTIKAALISASKFTQSGMNWPFMTDVLTTVFTAKDVTTTANSWNTHFFDTPFTWDGTSNILIQITFNNMLSAGGSGLAPDGTADDQVAYNDGAWADNIIIETKSSSADVTATTNGSNSNYKNRAIFNIANGPYNINITNNWLNSGGTFYHLNNTVTFDGSTNQNVTTRGDNFYNYTVNNAYATTALTLLDDNNVEGTATLTDGVISTGSNKLIILSSTASKLTGYSNASFVKGNLRRYIGTNTATYGFPLGKGTSTTDYFLSDIINNNLTTTSYLDGKFVSGTPADYTQASFMSLGKLLTGVGIATKDITSLDSKGYTQIDPNVQPGGGSYSFKMYSANYTTSKWMDNNQCIMKRSSSSVTLNDFNQAGTVNADNGLGRKVSDGYLLSTGLSSFSIFEPGLVEFVGLSVQLLDFNAVLRADKVYLDWSTQSEKNNDYFTIEKSQDGYTFFPLMQVKGYVNSQTLKAYQEIDNHPNFGVTYYRLKQTDTDGKISYSQIRTVIYNLSGISVFPNPAIDNHFQIEFNSEVNENVDVLIYNNLGQLIFQSSFTALNGINNHSIQLNHAAKGLYQLHIIGDNLGDFIQKIEF